MKINSIADIVCSHPWKHQKVMLLDVRDGRQEVQVLPGLGGCSQCHSIFLLFLRNHVDIG